MKKFIMKTCSLNWLRVLFTMILVAGAIFNTGVAVYYIVDSYGAGTEWLRDTSTFFHMCMQVWYAMLICWLLINVAWITEVTARGVISAYKKP